MTEFQLVWALLNVLLLIFDFEVSKRPSLSQRPCFDYQLGFLRWSLYQTHSEMFTLVNMGLEWSSVILKFGFWDNLLRFKIHTVKGFIFIIPPRYCSVNHELLMSIKIVLDLLNCKDWFEPFVIVLEAFHTRSIFNQLAFHSSCSVLCQTSNSLSKCRILTCW